uniref:Pleckstrin homology-like domain family A member 2 n=1 Tax=Anguilla anguilla TaxID=7936 RepID=A0A0E9PAA5_ANGAN
MKMSASELCKVLKEGELEKRSDSLLQFWKRKTCVLTEDSLNIYADSQKKSKSKELKLQSIKKVDCVERTGNSSTSQSSPLTIRKLTSDAQAMITVGMPLSRWL